MAHRVALYTVHVHEKRKPNNLRKFGNIDDGGTYLGDFLNKVLDPKTFSSVSASGNKDVMCSKRTLNGDDLEAVLHPGERGLRADIRDANGQLELRQTPSHVQILQCASLLRLPRKKTTGTWAAHVNHNRGVKALAEERIRQEFNKAFPDLQLVIMPAIDTAAYLAALDHDNLLSATLYKYDQPNDISHGRDWVRNDTGLQMELRLKPKIGSRLIPTLVKKAIKGDSAAFGRVVAFGGIQFDGAKVEVELDNGTTRTFNIAAPEGGHAFSEEIEPDLEKDGTPKDASLFKELRRVVSVLG